jgi:hypothetical protein
MFNMIFALPANPHRTMTMHAANGLVSFTHKRDRNLNPEPFHLASKHKSLFLFATSHQVMWDWFHSAASGHHQLRGIRDVVVFGRPGISYGSKRSYSFFTTT